MVERSLRFAYERLGPRYPFAALIALFAVAYLIGLFGVALLRLYQDMSAGEMAAIAGAVVALVLLENLLALRVALRLVKPAVRWIGGQRTPADAVRAWCALAGLPVDFLTTGRWLAVLCNVVPISLFVTLLLDLGPVEFVILAAGSAVVLIYGVLLRFFGMELLMRPLLEDVSRALPDGAELGGTRIPLRWKLLFAMPAINVVTGVIVSGVSAAPSDQTLSDLGWHVIVAVAVSFTISFELTLLLSRSVTHQLGVLRAGTERVARGEREVRVPVLSMDETGDLAASFNEMVAGLDERERLRDAFGAFVDPDVVERVLEQGTTALEGEEVEVSVLFLDIRGFTRMAERSTAREVVAQLNAFYAHVVPLLERHGGHANKFIGDGLLGVFGAPERLSDHADRAVLAALHIHEAVARAYGTDLQIGIGVNSGPVVAGTVGGGGHVEFTVIGDAVNTAARVEEATRVTGDPILVTEATRRRLTLPFGGFERRPGVALKGKREQVPLYAAVCEPAVAANVARGAGSVSAHVDRDQL
jgi:class 3 adenylate cyclase